MPTQKWTEIETAKLCELMAAGHTYQVIAGLMAKTKASVYHKWVQLTMGESDRAKHLRARREGVAMRKQDGIPPKFETREPPADVWHERSERVLAPHRDLSGMLMGDPPVGFSALERRVCSPK
ncbi:MAG: hypothetical protein KGJ13_12755 [Patescibacteria group bacterium]|nr:hypothetical protein [Patescibacteria group bacterium]